MLSAPQMAARIEHTLLSPEATPDQINRLCDEALEYGFAGVCVNPVYVRRATARLNAQLPRSKDAIAPVVVCPVGFPLGATTTLSKVDEARRGLDDGARHIDMVAWIGGVVTGDEAAVRDDIAAVAQVVHEGSDSGILKVILETGALTEEQIMLGCRLCVEAGADFVKTSTGFHPRGGATVEQVRLLRRCAGTLRIKASGGIRTAAAACAMIDAGADRLGTSSGVAIMNELSASHPTVS